MRPVSIDCVPSEGQGLSSTVVIVNNSPVKPTTQPTGAVGGARGTPKVTLPPTDTVDGVAPSAPAGDGWRVILLGMAALLATSLVLTPARLAVRKADRVR